MSIAVRPLSNDWDSAALHRLGRILFRHSPPDIRGRQVECFLNLLSTGELSHENVLLAHFGDSLVGVILCEALPGGSGVVWLPQVLGFDHLRQIEDALVQAALESLRSKNLETIQAFLPSEELPASAPLIRNGFCHLTSAWSMRWEQPFAFEPLASSSIVSLDRSRLPKFIALLMRTYEGSLDYPEPTAGRSPAEVEAGLLGSASNLDLWFFIQKSQHPAGVLILQHHDPVLEIAYLGIVPAYRRLGRARLGLQFAATQATRLQASEIRLIVDSRNAPAIHLYQSVGFQLFSSREVFWLCRV